MGKSGGGTKSSSRNAAGNNNGEGADVDAQNNKLGGSSRLAKHDPLQTYSQNLTSKELREVRDIDALDKQNPLAVTGFVNQAVSLVSVHHNGDQLDCQLKHSFEFE